MQRALLQYYNPKNKDLIKSALIKAHRKDLFGEFGIEESSWQGKNERAAPEKRPRQRQRRS
jgi:hypothetical protein